MGEASLCTVGKWSTKMAMLGLPVKANSTVQSVTVSLAENGSGFSPDWELQVYDRGSGREFTLRSVTAFRVDTGNRGEQTVALAQPAAVAAGQYLAVYCRGADVQLKCTSKESVKYECFYGSAPGVNSSSTLRTWSGRMGWRAALEVGGAAASASDGSGECPALCASVRVSASVCIFVCVCVCVNGGIWFCMRERGFMSCE